MFEQSLVDRLTATTTSTPPLRLGQARASAVNLGQVRVVAGPPAIEKMEAEVEFLKVAHLALGFIGGGSPPQVPKAAALVVVAHRGGHLVAVRYALDLRCPGVQEALGRLLERPSRVVVHDLVAAHAALKAVGLGWPRAAFSTHLAAQLLALGRVHPEYENAEDRRGAEAAVATKKEHQVSLLSLAQQHGVVVPASADLGEAQRQLALASGAPLSFTMAEAITAEATMAAAVYGHLRASLVEAGLDWHFDNIEQPGAVALAEIAHQGATVDLMRMAMARDAAKTAVTFYETQLVTHGLTNPRSHDARQRVLGQLGLLDLFRTARGISFTEDALKAHREHHHVVELLYLHSKFSRLLDDGLLDGGLLGADGRVHPVVDPLGSVTGRPTFRRGNLPGIGRVLRPIVVPDAPGLGLVELDFKAQEVFIAAAHFRDEQLLADCNGGDIYLRMVREFCADALEPGDAVLDDDALAVKYPHQRDRMKLFALTTIYGGKSESAEFRERFFSRYSKLKEGMDLAVRALRERGYAEGRTGLKRYRGTTGHLSPWEKRWAVNTVIQGGGACVLKLLLPRLQRFLSPLGGRVVLPIFDAFLMQAPLREGRIPGEIVEGAKDIMVEAMRELYPACQPRVSTNLSDPTCWNKDGHGDSVELFLADPMFRL